MSRRKTVLSCWAGNARHLTGRCWVETRLKLRPCALAGSAARQNHSRNRLGVIADNGLGARL
jgi:hypothetical protein